MMKFSSTGAENMLHTRRSISAFTATALFVFALGCQPDRSDTASTGDTLLNRDIALTQGGQRPVELNDAPAAAPRRSTPAASRPAAPASRPAQTSQTPPRTVEPEVVPSPAPTRAPASGTILEGTSALASVSNRVCTSAKAGDKVTAQLAEPMLGSNGVSIPAGATVVLEVTSASAMSDTSKGNISFRVRSIESEGKTYQVVAVARPDSLLVKTRTTETKDDVKKVAAGAIVGGILGQIIGKDTKGTVIGAAAGAAAGTAVAVATATHEGCMNALSKVRVTLTESLVIPIS
jgi:outer membrane lipoprotein SlyB